MLKVGKELETSGPIDVGARTFSDQAIAAEGEARALGERPAFCVPSTTEPKTAVARQAVAELREKCKPRIPTFDECADAVAAALCVQSAMGQKWIKAEDRLPEFTEWVLFYTSPIGERQWIGFRRQEDGMWIDPIDGNGICEAGGVTHWMPLPAKP
jgi:hypothetical protein